jgi:hypothetical protein
VQKVHTCVLLLDICQFPSWGLHSQAFSLAVCESFCLPTAAPTDGIATISNFYQSYMWWILCQCLSFSSVILSDWLISCSVFWQYWLWTQGFTFAMQELYHMSYSASLSFVLVMFEIRSCLKLRPIWAYSFYWWQTHITMPSYWLKWGLKSFLPGLALNHPSSSDYSCHEPACLAGSSFFFKDHFSMNHFYIMCVCVNFFFFSHF